MGRFLSIVFFVAALITLFPAPISAQGGDNRAAILVSYDSSRVYTKCVAFSEAEITGEQLLKRTGLLTVMDFSYGMGAAICSIGGVGCAYPKEHCFCKCQGDSCEFWSYYAWNGNAWQFLSVGASNHKIGNGALVGWTWGKGSVAVGGVIPPAVTFDQICAAPTATPTVTATTTPTATRMPTNTPTQTAVPTPTGTAALASQSGSTPPPSGSPPDVQFTAAASTLEVGACTVLQWVTWNAQQVTLDSSVVAGQDRREVCPQRTQRFVLTATNASGQAQQELMIHVANSVPGLPTQPAQPRTPPATALGSNSQTSPLPTPIVTRPAPNPVVAAPLPQPPAQPAPNAASLVMAAQAKSIPVETPTGIGAATVVATRGLRLMPTLTPSPTRPLARKQAAGGLATPTPLLVARVETAGDSAQLGLDASAPRSRDASTPDRVFNRALLPRYGVYVLMVATLVGAAAFVTHRKQRNA